MLTVVLLVLAGIGVFVIAAVVIGREARRLDAVAPRTVYQLEEAVIYVADRIPPFAQARLTHDEVRELLRWHMASLHAKGLQPDRVVDRPQDIADPVVVDDLGVVGELIVQAEQAGMDVADEDVAVVVEQHLAYLDAIGAVGPQADDPDVPLP